MTKCFAYSRISTISQIDGDGLTRQRLAIEEYAAKNDLEIVRWFEDKGISGKSEWQDRPAWSDMIASLNGVRTIIVENLSRLARELLTQELIFKDLTKREIKLISSAGEDTDNTDPTRVMLRQIIGSFHAYERTMIVHKLKVARDRKKMKTGSCEGQKRYGHYEHEKEVLATMRDLYRDEGKYSRVAKALNDSGFRNRRGKPWQAFSIERILKMQEEK